MDGNSNSDHLHLHNDVTKMSSTSSQLEDVKQHEQQQYLASHQLVMKDQRPDDVIVENTLIFKDETGNSSSGTLCYATRQQQQTLIKLSEEDVDHFAQSADYASAVLPTSTSSIDNVTEFLQQRYFSEQDSRPRTSGVYQLPPEMVNGGAQEVEVMSQSQYLDPALLRLIDSKISNLLGSSLSSLPADQKEMIYESVVRNVIGIVGSNRIYAPTATSSATVGVVDDVDNKMDITSASSAVQVSGDMARLFSEANINDASLLNMEEDDVSLHVISDRMHAGGANDDGTVTVSSADATQLIQVPISEVDGGRLLNFVSSSSGLEGREVVCLDNQNVLLDVVSSHNAHEKTLHLVHSGQPFTIELENQGFTDDDRYAAEVSVIHQLEADQNVTSTVDINHEDVANDVVTTTSIEMPLNSLEPQRLHIIDVSLADDTIIAIPDNKSNQRPKRNANKNRLIKNNNASSASSSSNELGKWCEECNASYLSGCSKHRVQQISDKPVLTRARASLPASYLSIQKVATDCNGQNVYGVVAKKVITKRTQFGPVDGVLVKKGEQYSAGASGFALQLETMDNLLVTVDVSDESQSNWMGFVRPAESYKEQNLIVLQQGQSLYYITTKAIFPKTELKVGYSVQYASRRGLHVLQADESGKDAEDNSWPCFECNKSFGSSEELQQHLNEHDGLVNDAIPFDENSKATTSGGTAPVAKKSKSKAKSSKKSASKNKNKKSNSESGEFRCDLCSKVFPRQYSLQRHQALHSGEKKYKCTVCDRSFTHIYNRNRHLRRHKVQPSSSTSAPDTLTSASSLSSVAVISTSAPVSTSSSSVVTFASVKKLVKTLFKKKQQVEGSEWECTNCNLTFDNPNLLNLHTLTHAAEDVAGLDDFSLDFNKDQQEFTDNGYPHLDDVITNEVLQCPQCTQSFPTKKELIEHASTHGKVQQKKSFRGAVNPAKPYKCELCYKAFAAEDRLQRHMMVHGSEDEKPLQCRYCEKRFLNNSALACHIKVHSDEKKIYECPICKEEFDQVVLLKEHIRIHSISGYFTCPSCQKSFDEYNQIRKHIRIFHSDKKFPCDHCDKVFPRPDKLKLHMLRHSTHREFLCASCGKQFKRKDKLKEHMKRMHSMEREARLAMKPQKTISLKKFVPKVLPTDYHRFIYKCHSCLLGFKRRGMLVNHLAKRHPDIRLESVPELNLPILKTTRDYYCQYCEKIYKSSSKRKAHIVKQHPGAELPMSNRRKGGIPEIPGVPNPTYSQTVGSVTTLPHNCEWCHKQYASKAKLLQHQRKKHVALLPESQQIPRSHHRESRVKGSEPLSDQSEPPPPIYIHEQVTVTTQTSDVEFTDSVSQDVKVKTTAGQHQVTEIYVDQDQVHTTVVVAHDDKSNQVTSSGDVIPATDLLTQAMSELTQSLGEYVSAHDYNLQRSGGQVVVSNFVPSPTSANHGSSSPSTTQQQQQQTGHEVVGEAEVTIDQSQLGHLLGSHYDDKEGQSQSAVGGGNDDDAMQITSSFIQQSWTRNNFSDYNHH